MAAIAVGLGVAGAAAYTPARAAWQNYQLCESAKQAIARDGAVVRVDDGSLRVAVLGDSYTAGDGIDTSARWVERVGDTRDWSVDVDGIGSTGFLNGGACGDNQFSERLAGVLATHPDVLVIQGGLNDWQESPDDVSAAASLLLERVKDVPRVVVLGPASAPSRGDVSEVDGALRAAASSYSREYVPTLGWDLEFLPDRLHMTPAGHAEYAARVATILQR